MVGQKIKRFLSVAVWMLCCLTGFAQYSVNFVNSVVTVIDGNTHPTGTIYDDGGPNGKYRNNFAGMVRIEADMGDTIIVWGHVKTEGACDQLFVYEGNGREGLIGAFCKDTSFALQSTSGYASLWFNTDRSIVDSGFTIHYEIHFNSCSNNVMEFEAIDIASTSVRLQWVSPDTNGPFLLDIDGTDTLVTHCYCDVTGLQSDTNYTFTIVSLADTANVYCPRSCTIHTPCFVAGISGARPLIGSRDSIVLVADSADGYIWNTGDTTREILVKQPGEYYVVAVTAGGCSDTAYARIIHVGLVLDINVPPCLCPGDQADIHVGFDRDATIRIIPGSAVLSVANEIFLPDGIYCDPYGCSYRSEQTFSGFPPGARIENVNDIRYVMLNIEHSWLGDLYMNITCPNGQSSNILRYGGVGTSACNSSITDDCRGWDPGNNASLGSYLGSALDSGDTRYPCDSLATLNRPGQGWRYCWSNATDAGYQYAPGDGRLYRAWNMVHSSIDSSDVLRRRQFYHPDDSFSNLVGCPMNGTWYIEVIDGWSEDNGYIFGWELALDSNRLMRNSYNPTLDSCTLEGPWYQRLTDTTFVITAPRDLSHDTLVQYILHIYDSNRHVFDTFFYVQFRAAVIDTIFDTITENDIPYTYNDSIFTNDTNNCIFHLYRKGDCHCDSTVIYNLFIKRSSTFSADTDICSDMLPLSWHGYTFDSAGTLIDTIPNHWGLDSVITLTLRVHPTFLDTTFATICSYDRFQWDDTFYSTTGSYHLFTHPSQYECDSSRYLDLYVYPQRYVDTSVTACDTFYFMGRNYDQSITDTIPGFCIDSNGCSVSAILHLTIKRSSTADTVAVACDSFDWYGRRYYSSLIDSLVLATPNHNDCDSMLRLHLRVNYSDTVDLFDAICQNDWLDGYSHIDSLYGAPVALFPFDTLLFYHTTTPDGCYRLEQIHLHVKANSDSVIFDTICQNSWLDSAYTAPAAFPFDTLLIYHTTSHNGCDSMVSLYLHVNANTDSVIFDTICQNDWLDSVYPAPAAFPFDTLLIYHTTSFEGCDSMVSLYLHVNANADTVIFANICQNDWLDSAYPAPAAFPFDTILLYKTTSLDGCDSTVILHLHVNANTDTVIFDTICQNDRHDSVYPAPAAFPFDTLLIYHTITHVGCDSMVSLYLHVNANTDTVIFDTICQNDWLDSTYPAPAAFPFDTLLIYHTTSLNGCDSMVSLRLHVKANSDSAIFDTICQNDWLDSAYPAPAAFPFDTLLIYHTITHVGCDSIVSLYLHVNANTDTVIFDTICQNDWLDSTYPAPAAFPFDTILLYHDTSSNGCDSLIGLHLHVNANPELSIYDTIYLGDIFSFGDSSLFADSCIFADTVLRVPGLYHSTLESLTDCDTLATPYLYARHLIYDTIYDTICQGDSIFFAHRYRSHEGIYFDTIPASSFSSDTSFLLPPDTIHLLFLTLIPQLHLYFDIQPFCDSDNPHYAIQAHTSAQYLKWNAVPSDPLLRGHENDSSLFVAPTQPTSYYVSAYHGDTPLCPLSDSITLSPIPFVTADIVTTPDIITFDDRELIAFNRDDANVTHHAWTTSYDADPPIFDSIDTITLEVPITANDVRIMLFVNNQFCADSDTVYVKVFNTTIYFPNVFTPDREDNNRFFAQGVGIIQFEMWIYDRRGSLVFHSTSIDQKWDGTSGGRICPQAAYAYKCRYTTILTPRGWQTKLGTVTLLR